MRSLSFRLGLIFGSVLLIFLAVGLLQVSGQAHLRDTARATELASALSARASIFGTLASRATLTPTDQEVLKQGADEFNSILDALVNGSAEWSVRPADWADATTALDGTVTLWTPLYPQLQKLGNPAATAKEHSDAIAALQASHTPLLNALGSVITAYGTETTTLSGRAVIQLVVGLAAVVAILLLGWFYTIRTVVRPLRVSATRLRQLATGDLTASTLNYRARDEVGAIAAAYNQLIELLPPLLCEIAGNARAVLAAADELATSSGHAAQAAEGAAEAVGQVAAGTSNQARDADDVGQTMEQLRQTIQQIAEGATSSADEVQAAGRLLTQAMNNLEAMTNDAVKVADRAKQAAATAQNGAGVVESTVEGMGRIREVVGQSTMRIQELEQLSTQIGEITAVISDISEQTNLLALNAAIEAARAGEHGRGFAVVADEVRKLAERSSRSAQEIAGLIHNIQERTASAVSAMETGNAEVEDGSRMAVEAGRALKEILDSSHRAANEVAAIARSAGQVRQDSQNVVEAFQAMAAVTEENTAATEEMASGSAKVAQAIMRISDVSRDNAASAQEVSASVEELTAASAEVASSAARLKGVAANLIGQVSQFKMSVPS
ncbi:MAG: methyl-accepting chemotaxis protein [Mycobacterium leprae]